LLLGSGSPSAEGKLMQRHDSEHLRPGPGGPQPPQRPTMTFWLGVVIACLLALITVVLMNS
jgi:hypothetical protein